MPQIYNECKSSGALSTSTLNGYVKSSNLNLWVTKTANLPNSALSSVFPPNSLLGKQWWACLPLTDRSGSEHSLPAAFGSPTNAVLSKRLSLHHSCPWSAICIPAVSHLALRCSVRYMTDVNVNWFQTRTYDVKLSLYLVGKRSFGSFLFFCFCHYFNEILKHVIY